MCGSQGLAAACRHGGGRRVVRDRSRSVSSNGGDFLGQIDADRTPGDASPAPDAAGRAELVDPRGQLVRQPLAVSRADLVPHIAAVHVAEVDVEARIPLPVALDMLARQIADFVDRTAETGRADHRAVGAGQTALGQRRPSWGCSRLSTADRECRSCRMRRRSI